MVKAGELAISERDPASARLALGRAGIDYWQGTVIVRPALGTNFLQSSGFADAS